MTVINRNSGSPLFNTLALAQASNMGLGQLPIVLGTSAAFDGGGIIYSVQASGSGGLAMSNGNELVKYTGTAAVVDTGTTAGNVPTNAQLAPQIHSGQFMTYAGTANAITLASVNTVALTALTTGDLFRARITTTNTGAATVLIDGIGSPLTCKTKTGAALPAGYFRTPVDTTFVYDGADVIVSREVEKGSNANGNFTKWEDGTAIASHMLTADSGSDVIWTFPTGALASAPDGLQATAKSTASRLATLNTETTTQCILRAFISDTAARSGSVCYVTMSGDWY